ncbi:MAG: DUF58 domain-containing protein [Gammaproteobacteria bacterium]|nr:DUF58 domain-containing protein [Gammaproteobacteria bacterium]
MHSNSSIEYSSPLEWLQKNQISGVDVSLDELLMYRHFTHLLSNKPGSRIKHQMSGQYLAKTKGRGMEFDEARHYQPGDDVRTIDWRVTARTGKTHTKIFREEKDRPIFIFCDFMPSMHFGSQLLFKSVQACHLSALIAWKAKQNGDKIGGLILSEQNLYEVKPKGQQRAVLHWLNSLKENHNPLTEQSTGEQQEANRATSKLNKSQQEQKFIEACAHLRRVAHPGSLVYLISDFQLLTDRALQHLYQLQKHCEVVSCWINDPIEQNLPNSMSGMMPVTDGENTKVINSLSQLTNYKLKVKKHFANQQQAMTQYNIKWLSISAGLPLSEQL